MNQLRWRRARDAWRGGRESGYPRCCIAHFCLDVALGCRPSWVRANLGAPDGVPGVVCGILHRGQSGLTLHRLLLEIWREKSIYLRPDGKARAFRRAVDPFADPGCSRPGEDPAGHPPGPMAEPDPDLHWY